MSIFGSRAKLLMDLSMGIQHIGIQWLNVEVVCCAQRYVQLIERGFM